MNANLLRRVNWLWKHRHTHDGDTTQSQVEIIRTIIEERDDDISEIRGGLGAYIQLVAGPQTIASGGETLEWTALGNLGVRSVGAPTFPGSTVTIEMEGYYNVGVSFDWETYTGGGTVSVLRTRDALTEPVFPSSFDPGIWSADIGSRFTETAHAIPCLVGDQLEVRVNPGASGQDVGTATLSVYLVDKESSRHTPTLYEAVVLEDGPLAYWRLGEPSGTTAIDSAGHASGPFHMTYVDAPTLGAAPIMRDGSGDTAVAFSGNGARGEDWPEFDFTSGPFTFEAWFNVSELEGETILQKQDPQPAAKPGWSFEITEGFFRLFGGSSFGGFVSHPVSVDTDYYGVVTYDGTTLRLYLDGVEVDSDTPSGSISGNSVVASLGYDHPAGSLNDLNGRLDEVAVYDKALTAARIARHYAVGRGAS